MKDFEWACNIQASPSWTSAGREGQFIPLIFGGTAVVNSDLEISKNGWGIEDSELEKFYNQFHSAQLRKNHGNTVDDIIGKVHVGKKEGGAVKFEAEVGDPAIADKISRGYIDSVSIRATAKEVVCSACGKSARPIKACKCVDSHELIRGLKLKELSVVAEPAFESAKIIPLSFSAAVNEALKEMDNVVENSQKGGETKMPEEKKAESPISVPETKAAPTVELKPEVKAEEAKKEEANTSHVESMGTSSVAILAEDVKNLIKKQEELSEGVKKMQMFWESDFPKKLEQLFWERKKEEEAPKKEEECKKEEEAPKKEEEAQKIPVPPAMKKEAPDEEDEEEEEASEKKENKPVLQAKTDVSQDTIKAEVPLTGETLMAKAMEEIIKKAKEFDIV